MLRTALRFSALATCLLAATVVLAYTEEDLTIAASQLDDGYHDLLERLDRDLEPHSVLEADYEALESRRQTLLAERAALVGCGCVSLDSRIAHLDGDSQLAKATMGGWDEN